MLERIQKVKVLNKTSPHFNFYTFIHALQTILASTPSSMLYKPFQRLHLHPCFTNHFSFYTFIHALQTISAATPSSMLYKPFQLLRLHPCFTNRFSFYAFIHALQTN
jgi:flagellar biosynthesis regulator FlbT